MKPPRRATARTVTNRLPRTVAMLASVVEVLDAERAHGETLHKSRENARSAGIGHDQATDIGLLDRIGRGRTLVDYSQPRQAVDVPGSVPESEAGCRGWARADGGAGSALGDSRFHLIVVRRGMLH